MHIKSQCKILKKEGLPQIVDGYHPSREGLLNGSVNITTLSTNCLRVKKIERNGHVDAEFVLQLKDNYYAYVKRYKSEYKIVITNHYEVDESDFIVCLYEPIVSDSWDSSSDGSDF